MRDAREGREAESFVRLISIEDFVVVGGGDVWYEEDCGLTISIGGRVGE